jgi:uncharacterized membrane protein
MNLKRIFGTILTVLGIAGLIYTAYLTVTLGESNQTMKTVLVYGILGLVFFVSGIGLIKTTKDES